MLRLTALITPFLNPVRPYSFRRRHEHDEESSDPRHRNRTPKASARPVERPGHQIPPRAIRRQGKGPDCIAGVRSTSEKKLLHLRRAPRPFHIESAPCSASPITRSSPGPVSLRPVPLLRTAAIYLRDTAPSSIRPAVQSDTGPRLFAVGGRRS
jgi:hypothetical protein